MLALVLSVLNFAALLVLLPSLTSADAAPKRDVGTSGIAPGTARRSLASVSKNVPIVIDEAPCTRWNADYPAPLFNLESQPDASLNPRNLSSAGYVTLRSDGMTSDGVSVLRLELVVSGGSESYFASKRTLDAPSSAPANISDAASPAAVAAANALNGNIRLFFSLKPPTECPSATSTSHAFAASFNVSCSNWRTVLRLTMPREVMNCSADAMGANGNGTPFSRLIYLQMATDLTANACSPSGAQTFSAGSHLNFVNGNCSFIALRTTCRPATCAQAVPTAAAYGVDGASRSRTAWSYGDGADWSLLVDSPDTGDDGPQDDDASGANGSGGGAGSATPSASGSGGSNRALIIGVSVGAGAATIALASVLFVVASRKKWLRRGFDLALDDPWWGPDNALAAITLGPSAIEGRVGSVGQLNHSYASLPGGLRMPSYTSVASGATVQGGWGWAAPGGPAEAAGAAFAAQSPRSRRASFEAAYARSRRGSFDALPTPRSRRGSVDFSLPTPRSRLSLDVTNPVAGAAADTAWVATPREFGLTSPRSRMGMATMEHGSAIGTPRSAGVPRASVDWGIDMSRASPRNMSRRASMVAVLQQQLEEQEIAEADTDREGSVVIELSDDVPTVDIELSEEMPTAATGSGTSSARHDAAHHHGAQGRFSRVFGRRG
ncbi:hypothetical protein HYH02_014351 [Chlamydomonas schloesseri]|uniref:Pherophorin domain-containing protein n=1 Tax=Chlamydomonas schloesseri TaxID=2026947 RepID=A0A835VTC6_9CHLO|nr:hypothetical protein HYH02_014351 [Chlamydomonas schloesseri]|eukprot:KAG2428547.1 hypothetical protein HYH02_014351 [Chlamydomonas schloesseri]